MHMWRSAYAPENTHEAYALTSGFDLEALHKQLANVKARGVNCLCVESMPQHTDTPQIKRKTTQVNQESLSDYTRQNTPRTKFVTRRKKGMFSSYYSFKKIQ